MAWTTPKTWAVNEVLTAANMNTYLRDNTDWLGNSRPHARVFNNASISITTSGTAQALTFNTERFNVGAMHSTSVNTGRLTVPTGGGGTYTLGTGVQFLANATGLRAAYIRTNATTVIVEATLPAVATTVDAIININAPIAAVAGDYFEVVVVQSSGAALNVVANSAASPEFWAYWETV